MMQIIQEELEEEIQKYDDDEQLKPPLCLLSLTEAKNLKLKHKQTAKLTATVSYEDDSQTTKPAFYHEDFGKWEHQVLTFELSHDSHENIKCIVYDEDEEQSSYIVGEFEIKVSTLKENVIQQRVYKCGLAGRRRADQSCDIHLNVLFIRDHGSFLREKLERRQRAYQLSQEQNKVFLDRLMRRLANIQKAQGLDILEELLCNSVRHPRFSLRKTIVHRPSTSGPGYESLDHYIYGPDQQLDLFLNGKDEEDVVFFEEPPAEPEPKPRKSGQDHSKGHSKSGSGNKITLSSKESLSHQRIPSKFFQEPHYDRRTSDNNISEIPKDPNFSFSDLDFENILSANELEAERRSFKRSPTNESPKCSTTKSPSARNYFSTPSNPKMLQTTANTDEIAAIGRRTEPLKEGKKIISSPFREASEFMSERKPKNRGSSQSPDKYLMKSKASDEIFLRGLTRIMIAAKDNIIAKPAARSGKAGGRF